MALRVGIVGGDWCASFGFSFGQQFAISYLLDSIKKNM